MHSDSGAGRSRPHVRALAVLQPEAGLWADHIDEGVAQSHGVLEVNRQVHEVKAREEPLGVQ